MNESPLETSCLWCGEPMWVFDSMDLDYEAPVCPDCDEMFEEDLWSGDCISCDKPSADYVCDDCAPPKVNRYKCTECGIDFIGMWELWGFVDRFCDKCHKAQKEVV